MNPASDIIPQNPERLAHQQPRCLPKNFGKNCAAMLQFWCGLFLLSCNTGIVAVGPEITGNDQERNYINYEHNRLKRFGKTGFGFWGAVIFVATAGTYFFKHINKNMVNLYFGFCVASAVIAAVGIGLSVAAISTISYTRSGKSCYGADWQLRNENPCCFDKYHYICDTYDYIHSYRSIFPNYNSLECELNRELAKDTVDDCRNKARQLNDLLLIPYGVLLAMVTVVLFASLYGARAGMPANVTVEGNRRSTMDATTP